MAEDKLQKAKEKIKKSSGKSSYDKASSDIASKVNREFLEKTVQKRAVEVALPYINLSKTILNPDFLKLIKLSDSEKSRTVVFYKVGNILRLAVENPEAEETKKIINKLEKKKFKVNLALASNISIDYALKIYGKNERYQKTKIVKSVEEKSIETYEKEISNLSELSNKLEKVPSEEALNLINIGAIKTNASDIHYEPQENTIVVRFRIDGILHKVFEIKPLVYKNLSNQIKYEAKMQLNVNTVPQDGRYTFLFNEKKIAVRVSSIPTPYGESFVCRLLISDEKPLDFKELGFQGLALEKLKNATKISHGMILATGPTGSGKTTTLYSILNIMKSPENKIITLEDPVEYHIDGVTQSQIDEKHDYTFDTGLKTVLRQDPDIVMLGEVRDLKTAKTCAQAALTGHVLLSTIHANSALETITRLINIGLKPFMVAPALDTVIAQRLVRKICKDCSTLEPISNSLRKEFEELFEKLKIVNPNLITEIPSQLPKTHGCDKCSNTGYSGRMVIAEVVSITPAIKNMIVDNASQEELFKAAREQGMITMREDGLLKIYQGITTIEEILRVTTVSD